MNLISPVKLDLHQTFVTFAERMGLREKYSNRRLKKTEIEIDHHPIIPELDKVKKVGVLWGPDGKHALQYLKDYFSPRGAIVRDLCFFHEDVQYATDANSLTQGELDWLKFPKPGIIDTFTHLHFDLLLIVAVHSNITLDYLTLVTRAKFKVGWSPNEKNYLDLNINIGENKDALFLAKQQIFYLGQLNQKTSK